MGESDLTSEIGESHLPIHILEQIVKACADAYAKDPLDAHNLTKWAQALLELFLFCGIESAKPMLMDAFSKIYEALQINPSNADALCLLGNAHSLRGSMIADHIEAIGHFDKAFLCFHQAVELDSSNEMYRKSRQKAAKTMHLRYMLHSEQTIGCKTLPMPNANRSKKKKKGSDLKYALFGGVILAGGLVALFGMAKFRAPPP